jgi:hypothetical protein
MPKVPDLDLNNEFDDPCCITYIYSVCVKTALNCPDRKRSSKRIWMEFEVLTVA